MSTIPRPQPRKPRARPLRATRMYAPCRGDDLHGSVGMDVWLRPETGRALPVAVLDVSDPVAIAIKVGAAVRCLIRQYGLDECSPEGLGLAALEGLGIMHYGEYLEEAWRRAGLKPTKKAARIIRAARRWKERQQS